MFSECFLETLLDILLEFIFHFVKFNFTKELIVNERGSTRWIACSLLLDLFNSWGVSRGSQTLWIIISSSVSKHSNFFIIDFDVLESVENNHNWFTSFHAQFLDLVLLQSNPVSLCTILIILELFFMSSWQIRIDIFKQFANVIGRKSSNLP